MRRSVLVDVLTVHGAVGKSIIFTMTKREADEVAASVGQVLPCEASLLSCTPYVHCQGNVLLVFRAAGGVFGGNGGRGSWPRACSWLSVCILWETSHSSD